MSDVVVMMVMVGVLSTALVVSGMALAQSSSQAILQTPLLGFVPATQEEGESLELTPQDTILSALEKLSTLVEQALSAAEAGGGGGSGTSYTFQNTGTGPGEIWKSTVGQTVSFRRVASTNSFLNVLTEPDDVHFTVDATPTDKPTSLMARDDQKTTQITRIDVTNVQGLAAGVLNLGTLTGNTATNMDAFGPVRIARTNANLLQMGRYGANTDLHGNFMQIQSTSAMDIAAAMTPTLTLGHPNCNVIQKASNYEATFRDSAFAECKNQYELKALDLIMHGTNWTNVDSDGPWPVDIGRYTANGVDVGRIDAPTNVYSNTLKLESTVNTEFIGKNPIFQGQPTQSLRFSSNNIVYIQNITTPLSIFTPSGVGSRTYAANTTNAGMVILVKSWMFLEDRNGTDALTFDLTINGVAMFSEYVSSTLAGGAWIEMEWYIMPHITSNSVQSFVRFTYPPGWPPVVQRTDGSTDWDPTIDNTIDVLGTWSVQTVTNRLRIMNGYIQTLGQL